jgi:hypothetical protein
MEFYSANISQLFLNLERNFTASHRAYEVGTYYYVFSISMYSFWENPRLPITPISIKYTDLKVQACSL